MAELAAMKAIIHGKVQGVYFRASTRKHALELGLTGTVRNLSGWHEVEVYAEGEKDRLDELLEYLKKGPPGARVERMDVEWREHIGNCRGFDII